MQVTSVLLTSPCGLELAPWWGVKPPRPGHTENGRWLTVCQKVSVRRQGVGATSSPDDRCLELTEDIVRGMWPRALCAGPLTSSVAMLSQLDYQQVLQMRASHHRSRRSWASWVGCQFSVLAPGVHTAITHASLLSVDANAIWAPHGCMQGRW